MGMNMSFFIFLFFNFGIFVTININAIVLRIAEREDNKPFIINILYSINTRLQLRSAQKRSNKLSCKQIMNYFKKITAAA